MMTTDTVQPQAARPETPQPAAAIAPKQKIITSLLWGVLVLAMLGVVGTGLWSRYRDAGGVAAAPAASLPVLFDAAAFSLTDQDGKPFSSDALRGKTWVADFVFTNCPGACPKMTMRMAGLQKTLARPDVHFVSFSVDPDRDTPPVLKQYAKNYDADPGRWHFLTGDKDAMFQAAWDMKLTAEPAGKLGPEIAHAEKFLLVDGQGRVRGAYDSKDDDDMKRLAADAVAVAGEERS
jgi:protein SCO1/2